MDKKEQKPMQLKGKLTLKDDSDDVPWLQLNLGPSEWALEQFKRMNELDDKGDELDKGKSPIIHLPSVGIKQKAMQLKGKLTLKDDSDDVPWLQLTRGPSEWALEEFKRMNKLADKGDELDKGKSPMIHLPSVGMTLVDPGDDIPALKLSLSRVNPIYCLFCGSPFYQRQSYGQHKGRCKSNQPPNGPFKFFCKHCAKDFNSLKAVSGHMSSCEKGQR